MKSFTLFVLTVAGILGAILFIRALQAGSDSAWLALGVGGTVTIYLIFSIVELAKDRWRTRWLENKMQAGNVRQQLAELYGVSRAQGQFLANEKRIGQLGAGADDLLTYEDALAGDVIELPIETKS